VTGPDVRVGIVSWNTGTELDRCLASLPAALGDLAAEVVVVDNASRDGSAEVAERRPGVRVVRNPANVGYARAMNTALVGSDAPALAAVNPDTVVPPGALATLVGRLLARPDVGLVAPRLVHLDGGTQHSAYRFPSPAVALATALPVRAQRGRLGRRLGLEPAGPPVAPTDVDWAIGAVHVIRAAALDGRAPYDERWFMYGEDIELCWWLAQRQWRRRYEADVVVPHEGNVAGAKAWGERRTERWLPTTYDWYARDRGSAAARRWAAANTSAAAVAALCLAITGHRRDALALARLAAVHARAMVRIPVPDPSPPLAPR
jgi:GT2 family glycosyltransferase